ncbi:hypothetical protein [Flavobacterium alkalisoli]|uniref:hypothetical protein n=1 Tax=Flavobacterium alkalisoli TaxID=2602769 RepID=UPI003A8C8A14
MTSTNDIRKFSMTATQFELLRLRQVIKDKTNSLLNAMNEAENDLICYEIKEALNSFEHGYDYYCTNLHQVLGPNFIMPYFNEIKEFYFNHVENNKLKHY